MNHIQRINEMAVPSFNGDMFVRIDDIGFNKDYKRKTDEKVRDYLTRTQQGTVITFPELKGWIDHVTSSMGCVCRITSDDDTKSYFCVFDNPSLRKGGDDRFFGEAYIGHINFSVVCYQDGFDMESYIQSVK